MLANEVEGPKAWLPEGRRSGWDDRIEGKMTARIQVRVTPRASRDALAGWQGDVLRVRVTAPPVEGKANAAVARLVAKAVGVPKSAVGIVSGAGAREKLVEVAGLSQDEALRRLREAVPL